MCQVKKETPEVRQQGTCLLSTDRAAALTFVTAVIRVIRASLCYGSAPHLRPFQVLVTAAAPQCYTAAVAQQV